MAPNSKIYIIYRPPCYSYKLRPDSSTSSVVDRGSVLATYLTTCSLRFLSFTGVFSCLSFFSFFLGLGSGEGLTDEPPCAKIALTSSGSDSSPVTTPIFLAKIVSCSWFNSSSSARPIESPPRKPPAVLMKPSTGGASSSGGAWIMPASSAATHQQFVVYKTFDCGYLPYTWTVDSGERTFHK